MRRRRGFCSFCDDLVQPVMIAFADASHQIGSEKEPLIRELLAREGASIGGHAAVQIFFIPFLETARMFLRKGTGKNCRPLRSVPWSLTPCS